MKFIELFAGIGGMGHGLMKAGFECVGFCEIDKFAHHAFNLLHNSNQTMWEGWDVRDVTDDDIRSIERTRGEISLIAAGFPCQSFSIAGKRRGFQDTRGTLIYEVFRFASILRPTYLLLENVKGLLNHDKGETFRIILESLDELGYDAEWQVLNSKNFEVPQNRERVFIVGHLRGTSGRKIFPIGSDDKTINQHNKDNQIKIEGKLNIKGNDLIRRIYNIDGLSPTLQTMQGGKQEPKIMVYACLTPGRIEKRQNGRRFKNENEEMFTLTGQDLHGVLIKEATKKGYAEAEKGDSINFLQPNSQTRRGRVGKGIAHTLETSCNQGTLHNYKIRKLTPLECFRLQSFPDEWHTILKQNKFSDTQLYKMAGNAVTSNVAYEIGVRLMGD